MKKKSILLMCVLCVLSFNVFSENVIHKRFDNVQEGQLISVVLLDEQVKNIKDLPYTFCNIENNDEYNTLYDRQLKKVIVNFKQNFNIALELGVSKTCIYTIEIAENKDRVLKNTYIAEFYHSEEGVFVYSLYRMI